tara:strand:+ start:237 stop:2849 length:2613 start_codon:yes stop_codon:yes gene_type:complete
MVYKRKKKNNYKKLAYLAVIGVIGFIAFDWITGFSDGVQFGQEGSDYYFNSIDEKFSIIGDFDTLSVADSRIAECETRTVVTIYNTKGSVLTELKRTSSTWSPTLDIGLDLLDSRYDIQDRKISRIVYDTKLYCQATNELFPNVVLDSYDLKLSVNSRNGNSKIIKIDTVTARSNNDVNNISVVGLFKETYYASEIEKKIKSPQNEFPTYIVFDISGDLDFKSCFGSGASKTCYPYVKTLSGSGVTHAVGFVVSSGIIGVAPLNPASELIIAGGLVKSSDESYIDYTLRFKNWSPAESTPKVIVLYTPPNGNQLDREEIYNTGNSLKMYQRGNDGIASGRIHHTSDCPTLCLGKYEILATGGEVTGNDPQRKNLKIVNVKLKFTDEPENEYPPITPTSGSSGSKVIEGEVQLGYSLRFDGGTLAGVVGKDAKAVDVAFSQLDLITSNEVGKEGKVIDLKITPHLTFPCTLKTENEDGTPYGGIKCEEPRLSIVSERSANMDVTYTGTVKVDGKEDKINKKYLYADDRIYNGELSQCEKKFVPASGNTGGRIEASKDCIQDFRIQPLTLGHTNLNDMVEDALCGEDLKDKLNCNSKKNEHDVKVEIRLDAEFELADNNMKGYAGLIQNVEYVFDFDYKPKKTSSEPRQETPDEDSESCLYEGDLVSSLSSSECQEEKRVCDNRNDGEWTEGISYWFCKAIVTERDDGNGNGNGNDDERDEDEPTLPDLCSVLGIGCPEDDTGSDTGSFVGVCEEGEIPVILSNGELVCKDEGTGEFVPESDSEVTTGDSPTGNDGQAGAGETDGGMTNEEKEDFTNDLGKKLEELDTGFSGIPDIGIGGFSSETVWIFIIVALIILFVIFKISRRGYRNMG